jgi:hypothetical protein
MKLQHAEVNLKTIIQKGETRELFKANTQVMSYSCDIIAVLKDRE